MRSSDPNTKPSLEEMLTPQPESTDPDYLKWRDEKVRKALAHSKAHPELRMSHEEVLKKFGLET